MSRFVTKLFKKRDDTMLHLDEYSMFIGELQPEFAEELTIQPRCDTVLNASGKFGYDKNPIPVFWQKGELEYLTSLRCECNEPFMFHRIGNFGNGLDGHVVDAYELICRNSRHHLALHRDMYDTGAILMVPEVLQWDRLLELVCLLWWKVCLTIWVKLSRLL